MAKQPENVYTIDLLAPISGTVLIKKAFKGQYIKTGEPLFEMGNLSRLWFHAEVYERDLPDIRIGQKAILTTPTVPGRTFEGLSLSSTRTSMRERAVLRSASKWTILL